MKKIFLIIISVLSLFLFACNEKKLEINYSLEQIEIKVSEEFKIEINEQIKLSTDNDSVIEINNELLTIKGLKEGKCNLTISLLEDESVTKKISINVISEKINEYEIKYDLDGGSFDGEPIYKFIDASSVNLLTPIKEGYRFLGFFENDQIITELTNKNYDLVAKWEKVNFTIVLDYNDGMTENKTISFEIDEKITLPVPEKDGFIFEGWYEGETLVENIDNKDYQLKAIWKELKPESIDAEMGFISSIYYLDEDVKVVSKILPEGVSQEVIYKSLKPSIAKIDENGIIEILATGEVKIKVSCAENPAISTIISINVQKTINPYNWIDSIQISNPTAVKVRAYDSNAGYDSYVLGSICYVMFEDINVIENMIASGNGNRPGTKVNGNTFKARYVTFHDVGATGTAESTSNYCTNKTTETSWHYTVGNDGIYQQLPLNEIGYHAGDGTKVALEYYDTKIQAPDDDSTVITINQTTGYFEINGVQCDIKAPLSGDGDIVKNTELPSDTGINYYIDKNTGNVMISNTYWNSDYKTLSNRGGNLNSIGIESCVNKGSNLWYTWAKSAKLISTIILPKTGLATRDVKQHNTFSGKNCPQTMRRAHLWTEFKKMIEAEYNLRTYFYDYKIELICDSEYVKSNGLIDKNNLPDVDTEINYQIKMTNTKTNTVETFDYKTTIPAKSKITY